MDKTTLVDSHTNRGRSAFYGENAKILFTAIFKTKVAEVDVLQFIKRSIFFQSVVQPQTMDSKIVGQTFIETVKIKAVVSGYRLVNKS